MPATTTRRRRPKSYRRVNRWLTQQRLRPGQALPPETAIADDLGISQPSVHRALRQLEQEGRIHVQGRRRLLGSRRLSNTILLLASSGGQSLAGTVQRAPGWEWWIFFSALSGLQAAGRQVLMLQPKHLTLDELDRWLNDQPAAALIHGIDLADHGRSDLLTRLQQGNTPLVVYGPAEEFPQHDTVFPDQEEGTRRLTRHLLSLGCRRLLRGWTPDWIAARDRGYEQACREHGVTPLPHLQQDRLPPAVRDDLTFEQSRQMLAGALLPYLQNEPQIDAVLAPSDGQIPAFAAAIRDFGLEPNRDVKLAGFDNYWEDGWDRRFEDTPPIASVDRRNPEVGRQLAELVQRRIAEPDADVVHRTVKPELVVYNDKTGRPAPLELEKETE